MPNATDPYPTAPQSEAIADRVHRAVRYPPRYAALGAGAARLILQSNGQLELHDWMLLQV